MKKFKVNYIEYDGTCWEHYDREDIVEAESEEDAKRIVKSWESGVTTYGHIKCKELKDEENN